MMKTTFDIRNETGAIFYQKSKAMQLEFSLVQLATEREVTIAQLENLVREVKEERKELVDETILEIFRLINASREATIRFIKAAMNWQDAFTRPSRPTLYGSDYIIDKVVKHIDFLNACSIKKVFNFQLFRGNALMLPFPSLSERDPIMVNTDLAEEIKMFANPDETDIINCYQFLINCLPDQFYKENIPSLQNWLINPWRPRIWIPSEARVCFPSKQIAVRDDSPIRSETALPNIVQVQTKATGKVALVTRKEKKQKNKSINKNKVSLTNDDEELAIPPVHMDSELVVKKEESIISTDSKSSSALFAHSQSLNSDSDVVSQDLNKQPMSRMKRRNSNINQNQLKALTEGSKVKQKEEPVNTKKNKSKQKLLDIDLGKIESLFSPKLVRKSRSAGAEDVKEELLMIHNQLVSGAVNSDLARVPRRDKEHDFLYKTLPIRFQHNRPEIIEDDAEEIGAPQAPNNYNGNADDTSTVKEDSASGINSNVSSSKSPMGIKKQTSRRMSDITANFSEGGDAAGATNRTNITKGPNNNSNRFTGSEDAERAAMYGNVGKIHLPPPRIGISTRDMRSWYRANSPPKK